MKILLCHNYYQQRGGEDESFEDEARLLEAHGHSVVRFTAHNRQIQEMSRWQVARRSLWNRQVRGELRTLIRQERPALLHCTNTFPLISPAAYEAARAEGVAVVQSLRNYRLLCPSATLLRNGRVCEDCLGRTVPWPSVLHGCYRESRAATAVVATMLSLQRARESWTPRVDCYYTLTEFARQKFIQGGLAAERIAVKPNFVHPDPGAGTGSGGYAIFVGRLSPEKGLDTLLAAWSLLGERGTHIPLRIVGEGPLAKQVQAATANPAIQWLGRRSLQETLSLIGDAACLVMPSIWYETFGRTIIEAFAKGTPVIASKLGAMAELVTDERTGLHFQPGNAADLAEKVARLLSDAQALPDMRVAARSEYESRYTAESNYDLLMAIYARALADAQRRTDRSTPAKQRRPRPLLASMPAVAPGGEPCASVAVSQPRSGTP